MSQTKETQSEQLALCIIAEGFKEHLQSTAIKSSFVFLLCTYRGDDGDSQCFPVQDELLLVLDLYMLDKFV